MPPRPLDVLILTTLYANISLNSPTDSMRAVVENALEKERNGTGSGELPDVRQSEN